MTADLPALLAKIVLAYAVGLFAPGYLVARLLRSRAAWALALPISMVILLLGVLALDAVGVPIRIGTVLGWELGILAILAAASWFPRTRLDPVLDAAPEPPEAAGRDELPAWRGLLLGGVALIVALAAVRCFLAPLGGYDTSWRWEFLAQQLLRRETLAFYPPVSAEDFRHYFFPDGFAPLVSTAIWWLYAAAGRPVPAATAPLALAQYAALLGLSFQIAWRLHSLRAGWYAVALVAATPLLLRNAMEGQETGLTALAVAGSLHALLHSRGPGDARAAVLAGLLAASGALAREYGLALAACAVGAALWRRLGWRTLAILGATVALAVGPWLLRNGLRSGNPLYTIGFGVLPVNPRVAGLFEHYRTIFGLAAVPSDKWLDLAQALLRDTAWPALVGLPASLWLSRRFGLLATSAGIGIAIWVASIAYSNGGIVYSARALTPAAVVLAIGAAIALAERSALQARQRALAVVLAASLAHAGVWAAVLPFLPPVGELRIAIPYVLFAEAPPQADYVAPGMVEALPPGTRILGESQYAHAALVNTGSSRELVPAWSPEVAFLFDRSLTQAERSRRLAKLGIGAVLAVRGSATNGFLLDASPFFDVDVQGWTTLAEEGDAFLLVPPRR